MTAQLVDWPVNGHQWMDTGAGGMYAMLVVFADDEEDDPQCYIDVSVLLTTPSARVSDCGSLWQPWDAEKSRSRAEAEEILRKSGNHDAYGWALRAFSDTAMSESVLAAIHIGSTHEALYSPNGGAFQVEYRHLTGAGQGLYDILRAAHGREPRILTFLDS